MEAGRRRGGRRSSSGTELWAIFLDLFRWIFDIYGDTECDICAFSRKSSWKTSDVRSMYSGSLKWLVLSGLCWL
jgi:hypothetical protein